MTPLQAFQKMRELCEAYHLKFANVKPQTVEGYPIDNIEKALKALEIIKEKPQTLHLVKSCENYDAYLELALLVTFIKDIYSLKEFDLLREVLL